MSQKIGKLLFILVRILLFCPLVAVAQMPNPYGVNINLETKKKEWPLPRWRKPEKTVGPWIVAIVDTAGDLVYYEKMDNTQLGSSKVAINKARSATRYKRPTKALQDALAAGGAGLRILALEGAEPVEGGIPLVVDGKIVGAIGVSGDTSEHDGQCAKAAADTVR